MRIPVVNRAAFLTRPEHRGLRVIALVSLLVAWEALARTGRVPVLFLPSPLGVLAEGWEMLRSGELLGHLASSLQRLVLGFAIGAAAGVVVGVTVGFFAAAEAVGTPVLAATFPVPKIALLPLLILWLFAGLRLGAGTALLLLVAAEMIAVESGIGFLVLHAGHLMQTTKLMVGIVVLSILGVLSHWSLGRLERLAIPWRASA
jgi:ABC-type nitrate/sulfonate/bicarbonate transport system permease component